MNYTILSCKDYQTGQIIDIIKDGNTYNIEFANEGQFFTIKVKTKEEAQDKYLKIIKCFINGHYNFNDRIKIIKGEL